MQLTKKEKANMKNNSLKLADAEGYFKVKAAFIEDGEETDEETGEVKNVTKGYIATEDGSCYGTISPTAIRCVSDIIDILEDGDDVSFRVITRKSAKNRDFITLELI